MKAAKQSATNHLRFASNERAMSDQLSNVCAKHGHTSTGGIVKGSSGSTYFLDASIQLLRIAPAHRSM
jgi:hypothetical protein